MTKRNLEEDEISEDEVEINNNNNNKSINDKKKKKKVHKKAKTHQPLTKHLPSQHEKQSLPMGGGAKPTNIIPKKKIEIREISVNDIGSNDLSNSDHRVESDGVLQWLLSPIIIEDFYDQYFGLKDLVIKKKLQENPFKNFFSKDSIDKMLKNNHLKFSENIDVTNYVDGQRVTLNPEGRAYPSQVWKHYKEGCSVRLLNPQTFNNNVWKLCSSLQTHFQCGTLANVYLTPIGAQGFAPHFDDVDVFIIQLEGKKEWRLYNPISENQRLPKKSSENFSQDEIGEPYKTVMLEAGDVMYFPRGIIHQAVSPPDTHSLHITISTYQNNTWGDLIGKVLNRALEVAQEECIEFREGLPRDYNKFLGSIHSDKVGDERRMELLEKVNQLWEKLGQYMPVDIGADEMSVKYLQDCLPPVLNQHERKHSIEEESTSFKIQMDTRVRLIRQDSVRLVVEDVAIIFHNMDNTRIYHQTPDPGVIEFTLDCIDALEHIIDSYPSYVYVRDLPVDTDPQKLDIVNALYEKGLLMVDK
ncbi:transcription factor jumonji [Tieghemostelium lacteum]|uniref:Bifunctional lysine-specific demethylase and histidyl-hydroxylase n=1 Tax=Tieghemostelium lacteum TaxID=361077 RepID=A0A151ZHX1_TIELA|nr:transcription factor jumonji [Tieghemostelium lacteum]|eukprot:KYQ93444.1 transcription factor jumonji [Tieghemostelium lacteum]